jgi:hypothetical protein
VVCRLLMDMDVGTKLGACTIQTRLAYPATGDMRRSVLAMFSHWRRRVGDAHALPWAGGSPPDESAVQLVCLFVAHSLSRPE